MSSSVVKGLNFIHTRIQRPRVLQFLKESEASQWLDKNKTLQLQWQRLEQVLKGAYETIPFYRRLMQDRHISPVEIASVEEFRQFPILTKDIIRANIHEMVSGNKMETVFENYTGGSTGEPLTFYQDFLYRDWGEALTIRHDRWAGWDMGARKAVLWGADRDIEDKQKSLKGWFYQRFLHREVFLNSFHVREENLFAFLKQLKSFKPEVMSGYANSLYLFALFLSKNNLEWKIPIRGIISAAETLFPPQRKAIEETFHCKVFNRYGSREMGIMASECHIHKGLHICTENVYLEILKEDGSPAGPGELGNIVVTSLNNKYMPLIRYSIGDVGIASDDTACPCGRGLPMLESVEGRRSDIIVLEDGKTVHGEYFTHLFYGKKGLRQFRVIQTSRDSLRILLAVNSEFDRSLPELIKQEIQTYLDLKLNLTFEYMDNIPVSTSGKFRFTESNLSLIEALSTPHKGESQVQQG